MSEIRVVDFETNGMEPPDAVIEAGWCDLTRDGDDWLIGPPTSELFGLNEPLKPDARAIHHITPAEIAGKPDFAAEAFVADAAASGAIIVAAHNWEFEGKWLTADLLGPTIRPLCTWKCALRVWPDVPSHSNGALRYWLEDRGLISPIHELTMPPHRAGPDAYVTAHLLSALLREATARDMVAWTRGPALLPRCPIGEPQGWKGKRWSEVDGGFLVWMTKQATMEADLKWNAQNELDRRQMVDAA